MKKIKILLSKNWFDTLLNELQKNDENKTSENLKDIIIDTLVYNNLIQDKIDTYFDWKFEDLKYQGLVIQNNNYLVYFTQKLGNNFRTKSRNTFIKQNSLPILKQYETKTNIKEIFIALNPIDWMNLKDKRNFKVNISESIKSDIKQLVFMDFQITKSMMLILDNKFTEVLNAYKEKINLVEYIKEKNLLRQKNKINKSIIIEYQKNDGYIFVDVYAKLDGANRQDTLLTCKVLSKLTDDEKNKTLNFWLLNDDKISSKIMTEINNLGFIFQGKDRNDSIFVEDNLDLNINNKNNFLLRNQKLLKANIYKKYNEILNVDECFACDYNIADNLIISHIYRHIDIQNEFKKGNITYNEAFKLTTNGDNGFLFCPNHDKEFEKGLSIIFTKSFKSNIDKHKRRMFGIYE
ncbi:hypothetical protein BCF59_0707 [Mycoplasmopsis mustelae]|uniref:HNH endonuclease n=1 Tax=Mycoplasmopsis mustelae TaxID=171289 RepID=A0A4V3FNU1_9BACT|nr:hypothetical protein [Mycoplasmopsis mustelae]TDV22858.1 hypothetical protein BCF59_0707 [Mycoplasmopsis mustelae]